MIQKKFATVIMVAVLLGMIGAVAVQSVDIASASSKQFIRVYVQSDDDDDLRVKLYIDGSKVREKGVDSGDTKYFGRHRVGQGSHTVNIKWKDPDTNEWYSKSKEVEVKSSKYTYVTLTIDKHTGSGGYIDAEIDTVYRLPTGSYKAGDEVEVRYKVKNTCDYKHTFYFGFSVRDENGDWWDAPYESRTISPGKKGTRTLEWIVPNDAPAGKYDVRIAVWGRESGGYLYDRLDCKDYPDQFTIVNKALDTCHLWLDAGGNTGVITATSYKQGSVTKIKIEGGICGKSSLTNAKLSWEISYPEGAGTPFEPDYESMEEFWVEPPDDCFYESWVSYTTADQIEDEYVSIHGYFSAVAPLFSDFDCDQKLLRVK